MGKLYVGSHNVFRAAPKTPSKVRGLFTGIKMFFIGSKKYTRKENFKRGFESEMRPSKVDPWWLIAQRLDLETKLKKTPGMVLYGEIYGHVQDLTYSVPEDEVVRFAAFDVYDSNNKRWLSYDQMKLFCAMLDIPTVPELYVGRYTRANVDLFRLGKSTLDGKTIREGIVVRRLNEGVRGRAVLKRVSEDYKLRNGGTEFQ